MFACEICKDRGIDYQRKNLVPHIKRHHPEIDGDTKKYMDMFPGSKLREPPKTSFSNKDQLSKAIKSSTKTRTGKHLSEKHRNQIGHSNKTSEKFAESRRVLSRQFQTGERIHHAKIQTEKSELEELYKTHTVTEIANKLGYERHAVTRRMKKLGIELKTRSETLRQYHSGKPVQSLTETEVEILSGELLGDGHVSPDKNSNDSSPSYRHSCKYYEYVAWLKSLLHNLHWSKDALKKRSSGYYSLNSRVHPELKEFFERFYRFDPDKRRGKRVGVYVKRIPTDLKLTPLMIRHWFLGDGCLTQEKKRKTWTLFLSTHGFEQEDLENIILPQLSKMGIEARVKPTKAGPLIRVYFSSFERFYEEIGPTSPVSCYEYKFKIVTQRFPHLLKEKLNPTCSAKEAHKHYRQNGFPFISVDFDKRLSSFDELKTTSSDNLLVEENILRNSKSGLKLANTYHPHMFDIPVGKISTSSIDVFHDDSKLMALLEKIREKEGKITDSLVRTYIGFHRGSSVSNFKPMVSKYIIEKYSEEGNSILDPCSGFGGRMLGGMSAVNRKYVGCEPEILTFDGLNKMANELGFSEDIELHNEAFEDVQLDGKFPLIFTCPPYYDKERYDPSGKNRKQSHVRYKTYEDWKDGFLSTLVSKSHSLLENNGRFVIVINDTEYPLIRDFMEISDKWFYLEKIYRIQYNANPFKRALTGEVYKYEPMFVMKKRSITPT